MIATAIHVAAAAGLGGMAGLLGGLFGVGGGFLVIPLLGFFYGMDQQTAQGTALVMVVPNVLWAFSRYQRRFGVDLRMAAAIAGSALIATYPTARFATGLDPHVLRLSFAVFLATTAGTVAYRTWRGGARVARGPRRAWGWVTVIGVIGGVVSGFFGVGGAFIAPPLLTAFFGLRQLEAQGLALALVAPSAFITLLAYAGAGQVDWFVGLPLALGGLAAISARVAFASRLPEKRDAAGVLRTLAAYRGCAGATGVIGTGGAGRGAVVIGTAVTGIMVVTVVTVVAGESAPRLVSVLALDYSGARSRRHPIMAATATITPRMPVHPHLRFGIGAML